MAEDGADVDALMGRMDRLQSQIDAGEGWELERQLQRATDALRCPPGTHRTLPSPACPWFKGLGSWKMGLAGGSAGCGLTDAFHMEYHHAAGAWQQRVPQPACRGQRQCPLKRLSAGTC